MANWNLVQNYSKCYHAVILQIITFHKEEVVVRLSSLSLLNRCAKFVKPHFGCNSISIYLIIFSIFLVLLTYSNRSLAT